MDDNSMGRLVVEDGHREGEEITKISTAQSLETDHKKNELSRIKTKDEDTKRISGDFRNAILVLAVLIATITYQAGLAPPPSIWKQDMNLSTKCFSKLWSFSFSFSSRAWSYSTHDCPAYTFYVFMITNTTGFLCSITVIFLALIEAKGRVIVGHLLLVSLLSMVSTYWTLLLSISTNSVPALVIMTLAGGEAFLMLSSLYLMNWCLKYLMNRIPKRSPMTRKLYERVMALSGILQQTQGRVSSEGL